MASKNILCPYCFNDFENTEALYQCESEERDNEGDFRCQRITRAEYDKYWKAEDLLLRYVWPQKRGVMSRLFKPKFEPQKCPQCGYRSRRYVCPHCFNWIPSELIEKGAEIISVIGSPSSGKTNYIIALINQLRKYGYKIDLQVGPAQMHRDGHKDEATQSIFNKMNNQLFKDKNVLQKTSEKKQDLPWMFSLYQPTTDTTTFIVFYDSAGEKFQINLKNTVKYLQHSAGVIMLLDTLSIDYVKDILKRKGMENRGGASADYEEIQTALNNFRAESGTNIESKPFAFVFSKFDSIIDNSRDLDFAVDEFLSGDRRLNSEFIKTGQLDLAKIDDISEVIEENIENNWDIGALGAYARNWGAKKGVKDPRNPNNNYKFFGVSALGSMPDENGVLEKVEPFRVMDPLVWILYKLGQFNIPIKK